MGDVTALGSGQCEDDFQAVACRIADAIAATAIRHRAGATWTEATIITAGESPVHRTGNATLYQGTAGVAWALADAVQVLNSALRIEELCHAAISDALARSANLQARGLYDGRAGIGLAACKVGQTLNEPRLTTAGVELLVDTALGASTAAWDVISGEAGILVAVVAAWRATRDERLRRLTGVLAARLTERSLARLGGRAWLQPGETWLPLCGLAHGASGAAWAFAELANIEATTHLNSHRLVEDALRYEASWFDHRRNAWPDLRAGRPGPSHGVYPTFWCHGAAGIGMTRLRIYELTGSVGSAAEAAAALQSTCTATVAALKAGIASSGLTLCHGHGGAAELFLMAYEILGEPEHLATARWIIRQTLALIAADVERWPIGIEGEGSSSGLMTGLAGVLAIMLRASHPLRFPPVGLLGMAPQGQHPL